MLIEVDTDELQGAVGDALKALRQVMNDTAQSGEIRVHAATAVLEFMTELERAQEYEEWEEEEEED